MELFHVLACDLQGVLPKLVYRRPCFVMLHVFSLDLCTGLVLGHVYMVYYCCRLTMAWLCSSISLGHLQHDDPCAFLILDFSQFLVSTGCTAIVAWFYKTVA